MDQQNITLGDAGELEFINAIKALIPKEGGNILRSAGDDCCVVRSFGNENIITTIDTFVEGVHFTTDYSTWEQIGQRAMAASVSDIAAMGGTPVFSVVSLSMPKTIALDDAVNLFGGLQKTATLYGCPIIGGETTSTPGMLTITVTVTGKAGEHGCILRSGAKAGDSIYLTGTIGDSMAGLMALENKEAGFEEMKRKFLLPEALIDLSKNLCAQYQINSMIDISDGLSTDINHICTESGCGAVIFEEMLPMSDEFIIFSKKNGLEKTDFAISSGEEFELLFTSSDKTMPDTFSLAGRKVTKIGEIPDIKDGVTILYKNNERKPLSKKGYEHFKA